MLTLQEFKTNGYRITFKKMSDDRAIISVMEERTGQDERLELSVKIARKLFHIIANSPFIFSDNNNEK